MHACFDKGSLRVLLALTVKARSGQVKVKWPQLRTTFSKELGCSIEHLGGNKYKIIPPALGDLRWPFPRVTMIIHKPEKGTFEREGMQALRDKVRNELGWGPKTFAK